MNIYYTFTVLPTRDMGSYSGTCSASYLETYEENALWQYNRARMHDGLSQLNTMPRGTKYTPIHEDVRVSNVD